MPLLIALAPAILAVLMKIIELVITYFMKKSDQEKIFPVWRELARTMNLKGIVKRLDESERQLKANEDKWDEIERLEREAKEKKK